MEAMAVWDKLMRLPAGSLVLASATDQKLILDLYASHNRLVPFRLRNLGYLGPHYADDLLLFLKEKAACGLEIGLKLLAALPYVTAENSSHSAKTKAAYALKTQLLAAKKADFSLWDVFGTKTLYLINSEAVLPSGIQAETIWLNDPVGETSERIACSDSLAACDFAYDWAISLLRTGLLPRELIILNTTASDEYQLAKRFQASGVPFASSRHLRLDQQPLAIELLRTARMGGLEVAAQLLEPLPENPWENSIRKHLVAIINKYGIDRLREHLDLLAREIATATIPPLGGRECIRAVSLGEHEPDPAKHYLLLNATEPFPGAPVAAAYLAESDREALGMETMVARHLRIRKEIRRRLAATGNLTIAYSLREAGRETQPAELALQREVIDRPYDRRPSDYTYSRELDLLRYAKMRFQKDTFGIIPEGYATYHQNYQGQLERYDFQFSGLRRETADKLLDKRVNLSATSLKLYEECPFHYLVDSLLRISPKETSLAIYFGNLSHGVMEAIFTADSDDITPIFAQAKTEFPPEESHKQEAYHAIFQDQLQKIFPYLREFARTTAFAEFAHEWQHSYTHPADPRFVVLGKIDRILTYREQETTYYAVVDYKTGNKRFSDAEFAAGVDIQLPFYLHLLAQSPLTQAMLPFGFYYQKANPGRYNTEASEDPLLRLLAFDGRTLNDAKLIRRFGEQWLRGVRLKNDGTPAKTNQVIPAATFAQIITRMEALIGEAISRIAAGDYRIKPLPPLPNARDSRSCEYCHHRSICNLPAGSEEAEDMSEAGESDE